VSATKEASTIRRFTIAVLAVLLFVAFHGTQHVFAIT
jgi:hypothetical protein